MELLLHSETKQAVENSLVSGAHAFMLSGPAGSGKSTLARYMATILLETNKIDNQPGFKLVSPTKGSIGIDAIRTAQQFMRLKTTGANRIRRVLVVEDAHEMTIEAQNAFLKILEEPPADTRLILTRAAGHNLLATITSRAQTITLHPPDKTAIANFFSAQGKSVNNIQKAYLLSGGQIGLMSALLNNEADHPLLEYVDRAKQFLSLTAFERLAQLDSFAKNREEAVSLLQVLKQMSSTAFEQAVSQNKSTQTTHWHKIRHTVLLSEAALSHNPNMKLLLTDLSLNI